jgi:hypothetical protein
LTRPRRVPNVAGTGTGHAADAEPTEGRGTRFACISYYVVYGFI